MVFKKCIERATRLVSQRDNSSFNEMESALYLKWHVLSISERTATSTKRNLLYSHEEHDSTDFDHSI
jgi:hypothetical protein